MKTIELTTISPFITENYTKTYPEIPRKRFFAIISLFILWQFILTVIPTIIVLPKQLNRLRISVKSELVKIVEPQKFTYLGLKDNKLVTDLESQPTTVVLHTTDTVETILVIDSTGKANTDVFNARNGKMITGVAILQSSLVNKPASGKMNVFNYSEFLPNTTFTWSKDAILQELKSDHDLQTLTGYLRTPKNVIILAIIVLFLVIIYYIGAFLGFIIWSGLFTLIVFSLMKPIPARRPQGIFKLAAFAYMGYWYSAHFYNLLASYAPFLRAFYSIMVAIVLPGVFIWFVYRAKNPKITVVKNPAVELITSKKKKSGKTKKSSDL